MFFERLVDHLLSEPATEETNQMMWKEDIDEEYEQFESDFKLVDVAKDEEGPSPNTGLPAIPVTEIPEVHQIDKAVHLLQGYNSAGFKYLTPQAAIFDEDTIQKLYSHMLQLKEVYCQIKLIGGLEERQKKRLAATDAREMESESIY